MTRLFWCMVVFLTCLGVFVGYKFYKVHVRQYQERSSLRLFERRGRLKFDMVPRVYIQVTTQELERAQQHMKTKRILFAGLARDIEQIVPVTLARLEDLGDMFAEYHIIVYENDSSDQTVTVLHEYQKQHPGRLTLLHEKKNLLPAVFYGEHSVSRFEKMAHFRNQYLREIKKSHYNHFDYVAVVDFDLQGGIHREGFMTTFVHGEDWDLVGANGLNYIHKTEEYYDPLAYRDVSGRRITGHCFKSCQDSIPQPTFDLKGYDWHPVSSCFGGLVIYKRSILLDVLYGGEDCEHVVLHNQLWQKGHRRMFINPRMLLSR